MRSLALATAFLALTGCRQTLHLYEPAPDAGLAAAAGKGGTGGRGGSGGRTDAGGAPDGHCPGSSGPPVTFTPDMPAIVIALDRSTDMNQPFDAGESQWQAAVQTLSSYVGLYSPGKNSHPPILFSSLNFPNLDTGCSAQPGCCASPSTAVRGYSDFSNPAYDCPPGGGNSLSCLTSSDSRPIGAALTKAQQVLAGASVPSNQRYVLLVTDGLPSGNCAKAPVDDCGWAGQMAYGIWSDTGHFPFVIRLGQNVSDCLGQVAGAGSSVLFASAYASLNAALDSVMASVLCSGTVSPVLSAEEANQVLQVTVAFHTSVAPDPQTGWTYDPSNGRLHLHNASCTTYLQNGGLFVASACSSAHVGPGNSP